MKSPDLLHIIDSLGWTLLHSLWEGMVIGLLYFAVRKSTSNMKATVQYAISSSTLLSITIATVATFVYEYNAIISGGSEPILAVAGSTLITQVTAFKVPLEARVSGFLASHINEIVTGWFIGMTLFGGRLFVAWAQSIILRRGAIEIAGEWTDILITLARRTGITKTIRIGHSTMIDAPMVLGYAKPIILLPLEMLSGLSAAQIESILLHELAHIRRHDYLVNLLQSVIEVILFFNPVVWIVSSRIRADRELCCDEEVVKVSDPLTYAQALHRLAVARSSGDAFSMAITGTKNKLLYRIKRIMKTSAGDVQRRGKIVPAIVTVATLALVSWLSMQAAVPQNVSQTTVIDTVKKETTQTQTKTHTRKVETVTDENGDHHTRVTEWDEPMTVLVDPIEPIEPVLPETFDPVPPIEPLEINIPELAISLDTLPGLQSWSNDERERWAKEFTEGFAERFKDFYKLNKPEFDRLVSELARQNDKLSEDLQLSLKAMDEAQSEKLFELNQRLHDLQPQLAQIDAQKQANISLDLEGRLRETNGQLARLDRDFGDMDHALKEYEKALTEQLVRDGYLKPGDKINSINLDEDDGEMKINGVKIKDGDKAKYRELHKRYFSHRRMSIAE